MLRSRTCSRALQLMRWRSGPTSSTSGEAASFLSASIPFTHPSASSEPANSSRLLLTSFFGQVHHYRPNGYKPIPKLPEHFVTLTNLRDVPGATKPRKRVGRGDGGGRGKTSGRGHKGQRARSRRPGLLFDGGTKHLRKFPRVHLQPLPFEDYAPISLARIIKRIQDSRLPAAEVITMRDLWLARCTPTRLKTGVRVVVGKARSMKVPVMHLQVSACDEEVRRIVEAAGGSVTTVYYTPLGLRAILKPENFEKAGRALPQGVKSIPPKWAHLFDTVGQVPPNRQAPGLGAAGAKGLAGEQQQVQQQVQGSQKV